jgi:hypothetical protein
MADSEAAAKQPQQWGVTGTWQCFPAVVSRGADQLPVRRALANVARAMRSVAASTI